MRSVLAEPLGNAQFDYYYSCGIPLSHHMLQGAGTAMHARDFLEPNEQALVLFTEGPHFERRADATGTTGKWDISGRRDVDRVIIYLREPSGINKLYLASYVGARPSDESKRYYVDFAHIQYAGTTTANWHEFVGEGQKPFRYVTGEARNL